MQVAWLIISLSFSNLEIFIFCSDAVGRCWDIAAVSTAGFSRESSERSSSGSLCLIFLQNLAVQRSYNNLEVTVKQALSHRPLRSPDGGVLRCYLHETFDVIVKRVVSAEVWKHFVNSLRVGSNLLLRSWFWTVFFLLGLELDDFYLFRLPLFF